MNCPNCDFSYEEEDIERWEGRCANCGCWLIGV